MLNSMFYLEHHRHALAQGVARHLTDIDAIDGHPALIRHIEAKDEIEQRALAGAARSDDGDVLADADLEREAVQNRGVAALILEDDAIEGDVVDDARQVRRAGPVAAAGRFVKQFCM